MSKETVLLIRFSSLGDVALTSGLARYLAKEEKKQVVILTKKIFAPLFKENPFIQEVLEIKEGNVKELLQLSKHIRKKYPHLTILDLHQNLRSFLIKLFTRKPHKSYAKLSVARRLYLLSKGKFKTPKLKLSVPQRYGLAYYSLDNLPPARALRPQFFLHPEEIEEAKKLLTSLNIPSPFVAIHPYASYPTKTWPGDYWQKYIALLEQANIPFIILGRSAYSLVNTKNDLTNKSNLRQTLALLKLAKVVVSTDSGPLHLAWGLDKHIITLFGPSDSAWGFFPYGNKVTLIQEAVSCRPCSLHGSINCAYNLQCLKKIKPKKIYQLTKDTFFL
jgi:ADP-heptose:LPS heptosyltransferase